MLDILKLLAMTEEESTETIEDTTIEEGTEELTEESEATETETIEESSAESFFDLDGEKLTAEQIREYRNGSLRSQDYTQRLSQIKAMEQQNKDAVELYSYLKSKPELLQKLNEFDSTLTTNPNLGQAVNNANPMMDRLQAMEQQFIQQQIDRDLQSILANDKMVSDVELFKIANETGCTLPTAYNIWRGQNFDKIVERKLAEKSHTITKNIEKNGAKTKTMIKQSDKNNVSDTNFGLSDEEIKFASKIGMSLEDYSKWK